MANLNSAQFYENIGTTKNTGRTVIFVALLIITTKVNDAVFTRIHERLFKAETNINNQKVDWFKYTDVELRKKIRSERQKQAFINQTKQARRTKVQEILCKRANQKTL